MPDFSDLAELLIGQWQAAPRMRAIVTDVLEPLRDEIGDAVEDLAERRNIGRADGVWLDRLGALVGLDRPSVADLASDVRFGFDAAGVGFDLLPFRGSEANDLYAPLVDTLFRRLVQARGVAAVSDGSTAAFRRAVQKVDPAATVTDNRDMTVTVETSLPDLVRLADSVGALGRTAGVTLLFTEVSADRFLWGTDRFLWGADGFVWS